MSSFGQRLARAAFRSSYPQRRAAGVPGHRSFTAHAAPGRLPAPGCSLLRLISRAPTPSAEHSHLWSPGLFLQSWYRFSPRPIRLSWHCSLDIKSLLAPLVSACLSPGLCWLLESRLLHRALLLAPAALPCPLVQPLPYLALPHSPFSEHYQRLWSGDCRWEQ